MKNKTILIPLIIVVVCSIVYLFYGYYIGFNCKIIVENHMVTRDNTELYPVNPDVTIRINQELIKDLNMPSNQLHMPVIIDKKLNIGSHLFHVESDSMHIYSTKGYNIYYPRNIYIGLFGSPTQKHMSIEIY